MIRDVPTLVGRAREGDARSVARLISMVEDGDPRLREVADALAPLAGRAQVLGVTGAPQEEYQKVAEAFFQGVDAHEKAGPVWAAHLDESR